MATIKGGLARQILRGQIRYLDKMYQKFIQDPDNHGRHEAIEFKNYVEYDLKKAILKTKVK